MIHHILSAIASTWHNGNGRGYLFMSGDAGDLVYLSVLVALWRHALAHTCHVKHCYRVQWKQHGDFILCKKHHPHDEPTADQITNDPQETRGARAT